MNNIINFLIAQLDGLAGITKAYSPELPPEAGKNTCGVAIAAAGEVINNLNCDPAERSSFVNITLRGNKNDSETLILADSIFDLFNKTSNIDTAIILCSNPVYAGIDNDKSRIYVIRLEIIF